MTISSNPTTFVIFGASGDLTHRKLIPALFNSFRKGRLSDRFNVVGFARRPWSDEDFRSTLRSGMEQYAAGSFEAEAWSAFSERLWYAPGDLSGADDYRVLNDRLDDLERSPANRIYYLATAPRFFIPVVENLGAAGMGVGEDGWRRLVVEKPFGRDLSSAGALNRALHAVFDEEQIYRIDHYLGKETAQNILVLRFANSLFEIGWNLDYVDNVQISVTESVDVGHRAGYYEQAGVIRDMIQNHLMQLLALVAMEPPTSLGADAVRDEKVKLLSAVQPIELGNTVRAQYRGYRDAEGVAADSRTPTYAAVKLYIDNRRWSGVPFYLRSGKGLAAKNSEIVVQFKRPPHVMFEALDETLEANSLSLCIQPDEGIHLKFAAKVPDSLETRTVDMEFHYRSSFEADDLPDAYERLLLDAVRGDASLFTRSDGIETAWRLFDPVLEGWDQAAGAPPLDTYEVDSEGPASAAELLARDGRAWIRACGCH